MATKICSSCKIEKPLDLFDRNRAYLDGRASRCKDCRKVYDDRTRARMGTASPLELCEQIYDKEGAEIILQALGYELYNKDNPVHSQFEKKMATKYGDK